MKQLHIVIDSSIAKIEKWTAHLTDMGKSVLAGKADWIEVNGNRSLARRGALNTPSNMALGCGQTKNTAVIAVSF